MGKWRKRVGAKHLETLLAETILVTQEMGAYRIPPLQRRHDGAGKNIAFPTGAKLYHKAHIELVNIAHKHSIKLRQSYVGKGKKALRKHSGYAHAKQMKRAKRELKSLKNHLGRVVRVRQRKLPNPTEAEKQLLERAEQIYHQQHNDKNKIYSVHEEAVYCINKGKTHKRYGSGNKVSVFNGTIKLDT